MKISLVGIYVPTFIAKKAPYVGQKNLFIWQEYVKSTKRKEWLKLNLSLNVLNISGQIYVR